VDFTSRKGIVKETLKAFKEYEEKQTLNIVMFHIRNDTFDSLTRIFGAPIKHEVKDIKNLPPSQE